MIRRRARIAVAAPFCAEHLFTFLARRALPGVEAAAAGERGQWRYARTLHLPGGPGALAITWNGSHLDATVEAATGAGVDAAFDVAAHVFDTRAPAPRIDAALATDPALAPAAAKYPGIRVPGAHDGHEILLRAIIGQQISVARARAHLTRLVAALGPPYDGAGPFAGLTTLFPTPEQVARGLPVPAPDAALDPDRLLRLPRRSIATVAGASRALAAGTLEFPPDTGTLVERLTALPGIGPWTAAYVSMRLLQDRDAWLPGDVALLAGARTLGLVAPGARGPRAHRELAAVAERWRPWRAHAAMLLWAAGYTQPPFQNPSRSAVMETRSLTGG